MIDAIQPLPSHLLLFAGLDNLYLRKGCFIYNTPLLK